MQVKSLALIVYWSRTESVIIKLYLIIIVVECSIGAATVPLHMLPQCDFALLIRKLKPIFPTSECNGPEECKCAAEWFASLGLKRPSANYHVKNSELVCLFRKKTHMEREVLQNEKPSRGNRGTPARGLATANHVTDHQRHSSCSQAPIRKCCIFIFKFCI